MRLAAGGRPGWSSQESCRASSRGQTCLAEPLACACSDRVPTSVFWVGPGPRARGQGPRDALAVQPGQDAAASGARRARAC
eukprot:5859793-Pleurochrysis_carterae.AAC.1